MTGGGWLWDRTGEPDAKVERLEHLLARYRHVPEPLAIPRRRAVRRWLALAAALLAVLIPLAVWALRARAPSVEPEEARPYVVVGVPGLDALARGDRLQTGAEQSARIELGAIGSIDVGPKSRLRVEEIATDAHHLYLERGRIHARVLAPPRLFQVGTPAGRSIDLGCAYVLAVDAEGACTLDVTSGEVAFESGAREVFVPAGAGITAAPGRGASAPVFQDAPVEFRDRLALIGVPTKMGEAGAAHALVEAARPEDSLTLFHLFDDPATSPIVAKVCLDALLRRFPPPPGVNDVGLASGDRAMRLEYRRALEPVWCR